MRGIIGGVFGFVIVGGITTSAAADALPRTFAVFGRESVALRAGSSVTGGDVGVQRTGPGPTLVPGQRLAILDGASVGPTSTSFGETVLLGAGASVGVIGANHLNDLGGTYGAVFPFPDMPAVAAGIPVGDGASDVAVAQGAKVDLPPGTYRNLTLEQSARLRLTGGFYQFASIGLGQMSHVHLEADVQILVAGRFVTANTVRFARSDSDDTSGETDTDDAFAHVQVMGTDDDSTGISAVSFGDHNRVTMILRAPNGTIAVGEHSTFRGTLTGVRVDIGPHVKVVTEDGGFLPCGPAVCPVGDACDEHNFCVPVETVCSTAGAPCVLEGQPQDVCLPTRCESRGEAAGLVCVQVAPTSPNPCILLTCSGGVFHASEKEPGAFCSTGCAGGGVCDANANCIQCRAPCHAPGTCVPIPDGAECFPGPPSGAGTACPAANPCAVGTCNTSGECKQTAKGGDCGACDSVTGVISQRAVCDPDGCHPGTCQFDDGHPDGKCNPGPNICGPSATACAGCGGKLSVDAQLGTTVGPENVARTWAVTLDGQVHTYSEQSPPLAAWITETRPPGDVSPALLAGVSTVSWQDSAFHERGFVVVGDHQLKHHFLRVLAIDDEVRTWSSVTSEANFVGATAALAINDHIELFALQQNGSPKLALLTQPFSGGPFTKILASSPASGISPDSTVAAAGIGSEYCAFVRDGNGALARLTGSSWKVFPVPGASIVGAIAAVVNEDPANSFSAFVVAQNSNAGQEVDIWVAHFPNGCSDTAPTWTNLGSTATVTGSPPSTRRYALAVRSSGLTLFVADEAAHLLTRTATLPGPVWAASWSGALPVEAKGDLGALAIAASGQAMFVGNASSGSEPTGYLFDSNGINHTNPGATLSVVNAAGAWTESALAERDGVAFVGSMVIGDNTGPYPQRLGVATSTDDGFAWTTRVLPIQSRRFPEATGRTTEAGDPSVAVDPTTGFAYAVFHELVHNKCVNIGAADPVYSSRIYVAKVAPDGTVIHVDVPSLTDPWTHVNPEPDSNAYLDHPVVAITSDGVQHYVWTAVGFGLSPQIFHRTRSGDGAFSAPELIGQDGGAPLVAVSNGTAFYALWDRPNTLTLRRPDGFTHVVSEFAHLCYLDPALAFNLSPFHDGTGREVRLRAGGKEIAGSSHDPNTVYVVSTTDELDPLTCNSLARRLDVVFAETNDGGISWTQTRFNASETCPAVGTCPNGPDGLHQFSPEIIALSDGGVVLTYWSQTSADPLEDRLVIPMVAVSPPTAPGAPRSWFIKKQAPVDPPIDLSFLPTKCGDVDPANSSDLGVFMGDQHPSAGGRTRGHSLRVESSTPARTVLRHSVQSWSSWLN